MTTYFSRNFITFLEAATGGYLGVTNYRRYCDTRVEDVAGSGTYVSKMEQALVPDVAGNCNFYLRQAFRGVLSATAPAIADTIKKLTDRIKQYKNYTGDLHDDLTVPSSLTASAVSLVMLGGIDKFNYPGFDFFGTYIPAKKNFLTWAPNNKPVDIAQEDYLNFFVYNNTSTTLNLLIKAYYDDGTTATATALTKNPVAQNELYQIPAGPLNSGVLAITPAKNLIKYDLWLQDQTAAVISEVRTYVIDPISYPFSKFFMILNSLGAYEVHRFYGFGAVDVPATRTLLQKFLQNDYAAVDGEFDVTNNTFQKKFVLNTGFYTDANGNLWQDYMAEIISTRKFFDVTDGKRRPMIITSASVPGRDDMNYQNMASFEARAAFVDDNFTPTIIP